MKKKLSGRPIKKIGTEKQLVIILVASLFLGIISGSITNRLADESMRGALIGYAENISTPVSAQNILFNDFITSFLFFAIMFLIGMSLFGFIFTPIFPFVKGFSYGYTTAFIYSIFGAKGIVICALGLMPQMLIFSGALIAGCFFSAQKSLSLFNASKKRPGPSIGTKQYCISFCVLFFAAFSTVLLDIFVTQPVINLFC